MSRTDKDKPLYARAVWWRPTHWRCPHATTRRWQSWPDSRPCDLPAEPDPSVYDRTFRPVGCSWEPVWDRHPYGNSAPPKWYINHVWYEPNRLAVRVYGQRAVAEYRATGQVELVEPEDRHRNRAKWLWW